MILLKINTLLHINLNTDCKNGNELAVVTTSTTVALMNSHYKNDNLNDCVVVVLY